MNSWTLSVAVSTIDMKHQAVLSLFYISGGYKAPTFFVYGELVYILYVNNCRNPCVGDYVTRSI